MKINGRQLKHGHKILINDTLRTISSVKWLNETPMTLMGGREGTKVAIEVKFYGCHETYYAYPSAPIDIVTNITLAQQIQKAKDLWRCWLPNRTTTVIDDTTPQ